MCSTNDKKVEIIKNIVLTGFMMAGKTQIGKALAGLAGLGFADTDEMVEESEQRTINDIFEKDGEEYFRKAETEAAKRAADFKNTVISTGGGMVLDPKNIEILRRTGVVVNLRITPGVISARIEKEKQSRPLIKNLDCGEVVQKLNGRERFYRNCDFSITVSEEKTPEEHAKEILEILKKNGEI